jgi:hypothetical protein
VEVGVGLLASVWMFFVPGAPLALFLRPPGWSPWQTAATCPLLSLSANYALVWSINRLGFEPRLQLVAIATSVVTVFALALPFRERLTVALLRRGLNALPLVVLPVAVAAPMWIVAFQGFTVAAPNQDAYNHSFWIARMLYRNSVLTDSVAVASPLQDTVADPFFYPFSWHTSVALASALFGTAVPTMAVLSAIVAWVMVLPVGLIALSRTIGAGTAVGAAAASLAQLLPIVPGAPFLSGQLPTIVGISLLPVGYMVFVCLWRAWCLRLFVLACVSVVGIFFVHSPEAATLLLLAAVSAVTAVWRREPVSEQYRQVIMVALVGVSIAVVVGLASVTLVIHDFLDSLHGPETYLSPLGTLAAFVSLSILVPYWQPVFGILVVAGLIRATRPNYGPLLLLPILAMFFVHVVAGGSIGVLHPIRWLTKPWYESFERTAWVAVPLMTLAAAVPLVDLGRWALAQRRDRAVVAAALSAGVVLALAVQGATATLILLRQSLEQNSLPGRGAEAVFSAAKSLTREGGIIASENGDGSLYAYVYNEIPVTRGPFDAHGHISKVMKEVLSSVRHPCQSGELPDVLRQEGVVGFLVGTQRYAWLDPRYTEAEIRSTPGLKIEARSDDLFLLTFDGAEC